MNLINALSSEAFVAKFGFLFEHTPWIVEAAAAQRPFASAEAMHTVLMDVVKAADPEAQLALLRAHPRLADKVAQAEGLTHESAQEQASAGLDRLSAEEFATFHQLNAAYDARFGFPFIIAVRLAGGKAGILKAMQERLSNSVEQELETALAEVGKIVGLRLTDALAVMGLEALSARVKSECEHLMIGGANWVRPVTHPEGHVYDVVIVGGGQSGLGAAFALRRERIHNVLIIDESAEGFEGPWETYARMMTLRTPKTLTSIDQGVPSLTFRAFWEAQYGPEGWARVDKIPRRDWMAYLRWYRRVLDLPVQNETCLQRLEPLSPGLFRLHTSKGRLLARKVILATGIQGGGGWHTPPMIAKGLPRHLYAHTSEAIDIEALRGKRVGILGGGASAFDNAHHILEAGVAEAHVFVRRKELPRINPIRHMEQAGLIPRFSALNDAEKYAAMSHFFKFNQPPTNDTFARAAVHAGFELHLGAPWEAVTERDDQAVVTTPKGEFAFDFLIISTGLITDPDLRPELAELSAGIARWGDVYEAPAEVKNTLLDAHPYLGDGFVFKGRDAESEARLHGVFAFNYSALINFGLSASALSGLKYALPKLSGTVADQLFLDDRDALLAAYFAYDEPEFIGQWPRETTS